MTYKFFQPVVFTCGLIASLLSVSVADDKPNTPTAASTVAKTELAIKPELTTKIEWASGLKDPQGMAFYGQEILLVDSGAGRVLRYSREGKLLGILAEGLKGPSQIVVVRNKVFVTERKANRVVEIGQDGKVTQIGESIDDPIGLVAGDLGTKSPYLPIETRAKMRNLFVVSHTTSKVYSFDGVKWTPFFTPSEADRYGYRCLANDNGTLLMSDEETGEVLMLSQSGRIASWVKGMADPSGITIGPGGATYITDEGDGGRLWRANNIGEKTLVADGLGHPRGVLFLDAKTALVSDRNGKVWKLSFPKA